jgi:hypothetical protein
VIDRVNQSGRPPGRDQNRPGPGRGRI